MMNRRDIILAAYARSKPGLGAAEVYKTLLSLDPLPTAQEAVTLTNTLMGKVQSRVLSCYSTFLEAKEKGIPRPHPLAREKAFMRGFLAAARPTYESKSLDLLELERSQKRAAALNDVARVRFLEDQCRGIIRRAAGDPYKAFPIPELVALYHCDVELYIMCLERGETPTEHERNLAEMEMAVAEARAQGMLWFQEADVKMRAIREAFKESPKCPRPLPWRIRDAIEAGRGRTR